MEFSQVHSGYSGYSPASFSAGMSDDYANVQDLYKTSLGRGYWRDKKKQRTEYFEAMARFELKRFKNVYENLRLSNPYRDMENAFEDLTINQNQQKFEQATFQQSQANILNTLRRNTGSGGLSSIAQSLAQQGQIAAQKSAANIGLQEQQLKTFAPQEQARLDQLEASGKNIPAMFEQDKLGILMNMSQKEMFFQMEEAHRIDKEAQEEHQRNMGLFSALFKMGVNLPGMPGTGGGAGGATGAAGAAGAGSAGA